MPASRRLSLGEGATPLVDLPALAADLGFDRLRVKREDLSPTGSHKARGTAFQLSALLAGGQLEPGGWAVISSSGNAAVAAAAYAATANVRLLACVAPGTAPAKLTALRALGAFVLESAGALGLAEAIATERLWPNLRPSRDPLAPIGYQTLGWELAHAARGAQALFIFVSSGATFVGLGRSRAAALAAAGAQWDCPLHAVQAAGAAPIAAPEDPRGGLNESGGLLGALGAKKTRRVGEARRWIAASRGGGWVVTDGEAWAGVEHLARRGVDTSLEGGAALAAAVRARDTRGLRDVVIVLTGHASQLPERLGALSEANGGETAAGRHWARVDDVAAAAPVIERWLAETPP